MSSLKQSIQWSAILQKVGVLLHVPAAMAAFSLVIALIFKERFALVPLITVAAVGSGLGQFLFRFFKKKKAHHLWDAMVIAALGWFVCSCLAALPIWWIAYQQLSVGASSETLTLFARPVNALFEAFSGLTSTGLTMMPSVGVFPYTLQWWRSLLEWVGGIGLIAFIVSLIHLNQGYQLYYAEAHTEKLTAHLMRTAQWIWGIYLGYTVFGALFFFVAGMKLWEAINHAMTVIATGGFTVIGTHFGDYSGVIQSIATLMMVTGAVSFSIHCQALGHRNVAAFWQNKQLRLFCAFLVIGALLLLSIELWNRSLISWRASCFEWISAVTTCGFSTLSISSFSPMAKLFLIMGMVIGGMTGSTAGGIKVHRIMSLASALFLRLKGMIRPNLGEKSSSSLRSPEATSSKMALPRSKKNGLLLTAEVLFSLWMATLLIGWMLALKWASSSAPLDVLFDVVSALSNVGLTSGALTVELPVAGKCLFMFLMWVGRLEILPALILLLTLPTALTKRREK